MSLPTSDRGPWGVDVNRDAEDLPCSFSISKSDLISFSNASAVLSLANVGRAADHAWKSMMSSKSIVFSSKKAKTCLSLHY